MSYAVNIPTPTIGQSTTCITCGIRLSSLEAQQQHHKSDWHTYNLKRKMVYLPPVTSEVFAQLVNTSREQANPAEVPQPECIPCGKKYLSFQAYDNHLNSKKHKQTAIAYEKKQEQQQSTDEKPTKGDTPVKEVVEQLEPSETVCLFCPHKAADAAGNYEHMRSAHGFFLPSSERLIDLPGMLTYLAEKLLENYDCLWCTPSVFSRDLNPDQELHSGFNSLVSVRRHMIDKGHCKLSWDVGAEREYADFYLTLADEGAEDEDELKESIEDSSMDADDITDEDQMKLNSVLLDDNGNWILDADVSASGIVVDRATNELVLNNRRLPHRDAVRRQRLDARSGALVSRSQRRSEADGEQAAAANNELTTNDPHHPGIKVSEDLLKSQNQLSGSTLTVSTSQLGDIAVKNASAQDYESTKRQKYASKLSTNANDTARRRVYAPYGIKV
ncbi:C2H2 type zinc-finger-domain-containing protein [Mortierella sp. GBAus27b]|nr:hypothetical protein BGX31_005353 [Mortierella sp. GBA43]KAI8348515.1 C2H2 type zinc-finger-domain-containing protein [Mortierella sp. GBAus27b]